MIPLKSPTSGPDPGAVPREVVRRSYSYCREAARQAASNFYWSFWTLPRPKRDAMYALYAFSRHCDDLADQAGLKAPRRKMLSHWRGALTAALAPHPDPYDLSPILPALADTVHRYQIPSEYLYAIVDGVEADLQPRPFPTFAELSEYCYKVASAVGLACIHVWGFRDERVMEPAVRCGIAFQMTNILRDLKEDAERGRIYLPLEDLAAFNYTADDLRSGVQDHRFSELVRFELERTEALYQEAEATARYLSLDGRRVFGVMFATYRTLLAEISRCRGELLGRRIRLSLPRKLAIAARHFWTL